MVYEDITMIATPNSLRSWTGRPFQAHPSQHSRTPGWRSIYRYCYRLCLVLRATPGCSSPDGCPTRFCDCLSNNRFHRTFWTSFPWLGGSAFLFLYLLHIFFSLSTGVLPYQLPNPLLPSISDGSGFSGLPFLYFWGALSALGATKGLHGPFASE